MAAPARTTGSSWPRCEWASACASRSPTGGRALPAPPPPGGPADAVGGWGLVLVERLADRWGLERDGDATVVWFELSMPERAVEGAGPLQRHVHTFSLN